MTGVSLRVVIAEDEAIIRLDLKEILEEEGYEVVGETGRGDEAVELVRELQPDLAILDIKMPGLDGLAAARHHRGRAARGVLILTAFCQRDLVEQARDAGALGLPREAVPEERPDPGDRGRPRALPRAAATLEREIDDLERAARGPQDDRPGQGPC